MNRDPRAEELNNLRLALALAVFALRLDAFEARLKGQHRKSTAQLPKTLAPGTEFMRRPILPRLPASPETA